MWVMGLVACATPVAAAPPTDVLAYAVFGIERVSIGAKTRVEGDAGVLFDVLEVGRRSRVLGTAAAPTIALKRQASASELYCGTVTGGAATCEPLPNPLIDGPAIVLAMPGNLDVSAARGSRTTQPLAAGAYGRLDVGSAARVTLAGGRYQFESIDIASRGKVLCQSACELIVRTRVVIGQAARLGADDGVSSADVILRIAAQGTATALDAANRAKLLTSVYAPSGDVKIGAAAGVTGAVVGNVVTIGPRVRLRRTAEST
jgi:hypothetical protein